MFPVLEPRDIERLKRFGRNIHYPVGTAIARAGSLSPGIVLLLSGKVEVSQITAFGHREVLITYEAGQFAGELAQLSDRPALVDTDVVEDTVAFILSPDRLRDVLVQEAAWGADHARAHPAADQSAGGLGWRTRHHREVGISRCRAPARVPAPNRSTASACSTPNVNADAAGLISRFNIDVHPPADRVVPERARSCAIRARTSSRAASDSSGVWTDQQDLRYRHCRIRAPPDLRLRSMLASEGLSTIVLDCRAFGGQAGASARIENYLGFPTGISQASR